MTFAILKKLGAPELLENAATIIQEKGQAKGITCDLSTGKIDALGALCLAAGAKPKNLITDDPTKVGIPSSKIGIVLVCVDAIEAEHKNIAKWSDQCTTKQIVKEFLDLRDTIIISIT